MKKTAKKKKLTEKQKAFIVNYLISFNATQAAIDSKYSKKTAAEMGYENLNKPHIKSEIQKQLSRIIGEKREYLEKRILTELEILAFSSLENPDEQAIHTKEYKKDLQGNEFLSKIKLYDKTKALEMLLRYMNLLNNDIKMSGDFKFIFQDMTEKAEKEK